MPGAFAEYVVMPEMNAWVSEGLTPEIAALQEPMGNAVHAAFVEEVAGQTAVVTGCGPIGLMSIASLKMAGARAVFATDINPERLAMATRMGADLALDAREDVVARLRAETDGNGVDIVLEMSGAEPPRSTRASPRSPMAAASRCWARTRVPATLDLAQEVIFKGIRVYGITGRRCGRRGTARPRCSRRASTSRRS